jgi:hypothetical protein
MTVILYTTVDHLMYYTLKLAKIGLQTVGNIYFYNLTLCITISLCKNEVSFLFIALYADNSLPTISYIVCVCVCVLSEGGHVGRNVYSTPNLWEK